MNIYIDHVDLQAGRTAWALMLWEKKLQTEEEEGLLIPLSAQLHCEWLRHAVPNRGPGEASRFSRSEFS
jgi:hypothetical protein